MKDILVLIASVILGIALAAMVMSFKDPLDEITEDTGTAITSYFEELVNPDKD